MSKQGKQQQTDKRKEDSLLSKSELEQLKSAFSDVLSGQKDSSQPGQLEYEGESKKVRQSQLSKIYQRAKNTFYDLGSREFQKYGELSAHLNLRNEIETRQELASKNLMLNSFQFLTIAISLALPRKWVNKVLVSTGLITFYLYYVEKFMLNYNIEQIALVNNRMDPIEQEARNLIEFRYRIQKTVSLNSKEQENRPYIQKILEEVDKKNLQYLRFKKVELLL